MNQFQTILSNSKDAQLRESNGKINQSDRNALRNVLLAALVEDLGAVMTVDGAIVEFEHDYWGSLAVEVSVKMKDPNYDIETAHQEYVDKLAKAEAKRLEAQRKADERAAKAKVKDPK